jgi:hypothetical protein
LAEQANVISKTTPQFWQRYASLPPDIRRIADKAYALWIDDPGHSSLHFKKLAGHEAFKKSADTVRTIRFRRCKIATEPPPLQAGTFTSFWRGIAAWIA